MKWSLMELRKYQETPLEIVETFDVKETLMQRDELILDLSPVTVTGLLNVSPSDYTLHYRLKTVMTVPSSRSLEPVELPISLTITEVFMTEEQYQRRDGLIPDEEILLLEKGSIDLIESIEDNLLLAIPMQVLTEKEKQDDTLPTGDGWEVISEDVYQQRQEEADSQTDPRLAKLSELFNVVEEDNQ